MANQSYGGSGLFGQPSFGDYSGLSGGVPVQMTPEEIQYQILKQDVPDYQNIMDMYFGTPNTSSFNANVNSRYMGLPTNPYVNPPPDLEPVPRMDYTQRKAVVPVEAVNQMEVRKDLPPAPNGQMWEFDANSNQYVLVVDPLSNLSQDASQTAPVASAPQVAMPVPVLAPAPALAPALLAEGSAAEDRLKLPIDRRNQQEQIEALKLLLNGASTAAPTSVVAGMFPEVEAMQRALYQQKQNEAMQAQAMQFARLSPMQQAQYSLYMGGQQLGGAIGSALGGKDPQLQMIAQRQQMLNMIDPNKPETYGRAIQYALQTGDRNTALMLNDEMKNAQARKTENLQLGLQKLAQTLYKPDGSIDENVYATLQSYGAVGQAVIDQQAKGFQGLQTQKAQSLGRRLFNADGVRDKEVEKQLSATPEGLAILKQFAPETKVFKRGDIITEINPVTGDYKIVTPTGLRTVPAGANPIKAMIDNKAIDPTVNAFATEIANQWDNLDDKDRSNAIESLTKVNNQALDRNQKKVEASVGGSEKVQSSKFTPDGTTIFAMKDGTTKVVNALGQILKGQAAADAIRASEEFGAETQGSRAQARGVGELSAKQVGQAFAEVGKIKKNIGNIDEAIAAIDEGASTGVIASKFPNITAASVKLANVRQQLGLDVIGSVTFGALSEGELNLALDTALPTGLAPKDLRVYLVNKKNAQTKLAGYLSKQATYLSKPGNSLAGWLEKVDNEANVAQPEIPAGVTVKRKN